MKLIKSSWLHKYQGQARTHQIESRFMVKIDMNSDLIVLGSVLFKIKI